MRCVVKLNKRDDDESSDATKDDPELQVLKDDLMDELSRPQ